MTTASPTRSHERETMVRHQLLERGISPRVGEAMKRVPRELFLPAKMEKAAYVDSPLPIGEGQTISQPYMVALACELAKIRPGDKVLDVGTGSGYQAAVLAELGAQVHSIERLPALAASGRRNLERAGYDVKVHVGDGSLGLPQEAPFQAILVAAASPQIPPSYQEQVALHGRVVVPVGNTFLQRLIVWIKRPQKPTVFQSIPCRFVPLLGAGGYDSATEQRTSS